MKRDAAADGTLWRLGPWGAFLTVAGCGAVLPWFVSLGNPPLLPALSLLALVGAALLLMSAWHACRGMALKPAIAWGILSCDLAAGSAIAALIEPVAAGRPWQGHLVYLSSLAAMAAAISIFGARKPGGGAWALLMALLVLVLLIPWLESWGLRGKAAALNRLRLEPPWSLFFGLLVLAGATNYLPTRHGGAAGLFGLALGTELVALMYPDWPPERRARLWAVVPFLLALVTFRASGEWRHRRRAEPGLPALWLWFRDAWGVVWALRVRERFNRSAELANWPIRLDWYGVVPIETGGDVVIPAEAEETFRGLLRRFASAERIEQAAGSATLRPCPAEPPPGE